MYEFNSFIELNDFGGYVSITDSSFTHMNSCGSLIRNKRFLWTDTTLPQTNFPEVYNYRATNYQYGLINNKYHGTGVPASTPYTCETNAGGTGDNTATACYSIYMAGNTFSYFGSMKTATSTPYFVDPSKGMKYYGSILDLNEFFGPIYLYRNTFSNNVLKHTNCDVTGSMESSTFMGTDHYALYGTKTDL